MFSLPHNLYTLVDMLCEIPVPSENAEFLLDKHCTECV